MVRITNLRRQVRRLEDFIDTHLDTPWYRRLWFWLQGWPLHGIVDKPGWRPWRWRS